jgi:hypothetical protein
MSEIVIVSNDNGNEFFIEPGKYIFVDPCYIFSGDNWDILCSALETSGKIVLAFSGKEYPLIYSSTAFGDGSYLSISIDGKYKNVDVDSGTLSIIPFELVEMFDFGIEGSSFEVYSKVPVYIKDGNWDGAIICNTFINEDDSFDDADGDFDSEEIEYE